MITPSGRFQTNTRLCLSISDYHPDTWNPAWTLSTILVGITSFMNESSPTLGSISTSDSEKSKLAKKSYAFNVKNRTFCLLFPELADNLREIIRKEEEANRLANELGNGVQFEQCLNTSQDPSVSAWLYNLIIFTALIAVGMFVKYVVTAA